MTVDDDEPSGVRFVATPIQLAGMLRQATISRASTLSNRFWGAMSVVGGAAEMVASVPLWVAPEPTLATKFGAAFLTGMGGDVAGTGLTQVWTGRRTITLTAKAARGALRKLGVDPDLAERLAQGTDMAVNLSALVAAPLSVARTADAVRVGSIERGLIDLEVEETFPGAHTIAKHVGRTVEQLNARLAAEPARAEVSTFRTMGDAEQGVSEVIRACASDIEAWAVRAPLGAIQRFRVSNASIAGIVVSRAGTVRESSQVVVALKKYLSEDRLYYVLTAFVE